MPNSPSPTTVKHITEPPANATLSAVGKTSNIAACVVRTFTSVAMSMPAHPEEAVRIAPARNQITILIPSPKLLPYCPVPITKRILKTITNAKRYLYDSPVVVGPTVTEVGSPLTEVNSSVAVGPLVTKYSSK